MLLSWIKILFDKDSREEMRHLYTLLRRSRDWEKSIRTLKCRVRKKRDIKYSAYLSAVEENLADCSYSLEDIRNIIFITQELVSNALVHGKPVRGNGVAGIRIVISKEDCGIAVIDAGHGFSLSDKIAALSERTEDTEVPHGLNAIYRLCPNIETDFTFRRHRVSVVYHRGAQPLALTSSNGVLVADCSVCRNLGGEDLDFLSKAFHKQQEIGRIVIRLIMSNVSHDDGCETAAIRLFSEELSSLMAEFPSVKVAIVGAQYLAAPTRQYLENEYRCFKTVKAAVAFLKDT
jgi:anti-sigma regulatory factor (Ser/Thr protein kinase)